MLSSLLCGVRFVARACLVFAAFAPGSAFAQAPEAPPAPAIGPQTTPPELVKFVEAPYPEEARTRGIEGSVVLELTLDAEGKVTQAVVKEPAGHGFDEAAVAAALGFEFRPARRGERAVASRLLYRYVFELEAREVEKAVTVAALTGRIVVSGSDHPLAGAAVRLMRGHEKLAERLTQSDGRFSFPDLAPGPYRIEVEAAGFEPYAASEELRASEETEVTYGLVAQGDSTEEVVVRGRRPSREVTRRTMSRRELTRIPGTSGDALRAIQNLPGVARPPALSGVLVVRGNADPGVGAPPVGPQVAFPAQTFERDEWFMLPAVYAEMDMRPAARTQVVTGVRLDYTAWTARLDVSPRITARYAVVPSFPRTTLKGGTGLFHQGPDLLEVLLKDDDTELRSARAWQNSAGVEQELTRNVTASVEGFVNLLDDLVTRAPNENGVLEYGNHGTGRIFGAETMLRYENDDRFFGWLSYTLSRSERTWAPGEPSELFYLDQTHVLTVLGSYDLGRGWEFGARFRFVSGNLYTPCRGSLFSSTSTSHLCIPGPVNSERLPPFHQLDLRVDKRWKFSGFTLGAYLDLINAYNRTNPDFLAYNFDYSNSRPETASLPIVPSIGLRGEF